MSINFLSKTKLYRVKNKVIYSQNNEEDGWKNPRSIHGNSMKFPMSTLFEMRGSIFYKTNYFEDKSLH